MRCICCEEAKDTRFGVCFDCADFESLVCDKIDMNDNKVVKLLPQYSESLNIVKRIIEYGKSQTRRTKK